ncbi:MAG: lipopolysaccharide biosynthesis protein [Candidatus Poseidoniaceae archaeon]
MRAAYAKAPRLIRDAGSHIGADLVVLTLGVVCQMVLVHLVTTSTYGAWVLLCNAAGTLFLLVHFGLPTLVARHVPQSPTDARPMVRRLVGAQASLLMMCGLIGGALVLITGSFGLPLMLFGLLFLDLTLHHLASVPRAGLRALGCAPWDAAARIVERGVLCGGYVLMLLIGANDLLLIAGAGVISNLASFGFIWWLFNRVAPDDAGTQDTSPSLRTMLWLGLPVFLTMWFQRTLWDVNEYFLAAWNGLDAVAAYHVAWVVIGGALSIPLAMRQAMLPVFSACKGDHAALLAEVRRTMRILHAMLPLGLLILVGGSLLLMGVVFPDAYLEGSWRGDSALALVLLMSGAWCLGVLASPFSVLVLLQPNTWRYAALHGSVFCLGVIAAAVLVTSFGLVGAAASCLVAMTGRLLLGLKMSGVCRDLCQGWMRPTLATTGCVLTGVMLWSSFTWLGPASTIVLLLVVTLGLTAANVVSFVDANQRTTPTAVAATVLGTVNTRLE